jgi:hypothetical protein
MLRPAAAYPQLAKHAVEATHWIAIRRPLRMAIVLGCAMSLMTEGRITLRLAVPAAIYWSFIPLFQAACLILSYRQARPEIPLARAIDLAFAGATPWLLWLTAYTSIWVFLPPAGGYTWSNRHEIWYSLAACAALWSAYIDFHYFRVIFGKTAASAGGTILWHRFVCWALGLSIFVLSAGWQTVAERLGL